MPPIRRDVDAEQLAAATGIFIVAERGRMSVHNGWLTIGAITIRGFRIEIRPRIGVTSDQTRRLMAVAGRVLLQGPDEGWSRRGADWGTVVQMRYPSVGDVPGSASNSSAGAGTVLICSGSSEPSGL